MFYSEEPDQVLQKLNTTRSGLSREEAARRLEQNGPNALTEGKKKSVLRVFLEQFADFLVIILIISAVISIVTDNAESAIVILCVLILNAVLGTVQHCKAEQSLESLKALSAPHAKVLRDGMPCEIPASEVVVGDILLLEAGDIAAADGRVLEGVSLQVNESGLTGESCGVEKSERVLPAKELPLADRKNMIYSGCPVLTGRGSVAVTATGMETEMGKIASLMQSAQEKKTPLQKSLDDFGKWLSVGILVICALVLGLSLWRGETWTNALMFAVALAVAAIPEALSSVMTIALAVGTRKMARENAIVKELKSVEGLGCVSVICSDKTGTLTQNKMTVREVYLDGTIQKAETFDRSEPDAQKLLRAMVLCNDALCTEDGMLGDPTETALLECYGRDCCEAERRRCPRIGELPFDSDRKKMSALHRVDGEEILFTKGAVDAMLPEIRWVRVGGELKSFTAEEREKLLQANEDFSSRGMRVLCFCARPFSEGELSLDGECDYTLLGLTAMTDPPRPESAAAVAECIKAGIRPIMITGDHKVTATAIAREIGIFRPGDMALEGSEIDAYSDEELSELLPKISVYARVSPAHKIRIVTLWQRLGHIVAMTGDGVNDAPALKQADIGVAMGITGTQVSKDAASMILTDDNFATIVKSVENGRNIFRNIKNAVQFLISGNAAAILTVLITVLLGLPMPFTAVHLLFLNLLTDSLPALAISMEPGTSDVMRQKPRDRRQGILDGKLLGATLAQGGLLALATLAAYAAGLQVSAEAASTMAFATLCLGRLFGGFNCRSERSLLKIGLRSNPFSLLAFGAGVLLLAVALFVPFLHGIFTTAVLDLAAYGQILLFAVLPTLILQGYKLIRYR